MRPALERSFAAIERAPHFAHGMNGKWKERASRSGFPECPLLLLAALAGGPLDVTLAVPLREDKGVVLG
jgi:hypothetical protein